MKSHLRPFTRRDLFDVLTIELISYPDPWTQDVFESELEPRGFNYALVAEDKKTHRLIGYCFYWIISEDEIHINNIAVHPNYRRQGIALEMIRYVIDQGRPHDVKSVTLEVRESNEKARELYRKIGFEQVGRRPRYYVHPKEDALILRLQIKEWDRKAGELFEGSECEM